MAVPGFVTGRPVLQAWPVPTSARSGKADGSNVVQVCDATMLRWMRKRGQKFFYTMTGLAPVLVASGSHSFNY